MKRRDAMLPGMLMALAGSSAQGAVLPDLTRSPKDSRTIQEPFGEVNVYFDGATEQLQSFVGGRVILKPGAEPHPPHKHPDEEIMLVTGGSGEISVEGKVTKVAEGAMMYCGAWKMHGIRNTGKTPLTFYYYKWIAKK
jgi:quercetin dioxygenase-like cupin family protein